MSGRVTWLLLPIGVLHNASTRGCLINESPRRPLLITLHTIRHELIAFSPAEPERLIHAEICIVAGVSA